MPSWRGNGEKKQSQFLDFPEKNLLPLAFQNSRTLISLHQSLKRYINIIKITQFTNSRDRIWIQVYLTLKLTFLYAHFCKCVCAQSFSHVRLFVTPWTIAHQAPLSIGFPRQEYWSGLFSPPRDLHDPGIEPASPALAGGFFPIEPPGNSQDQ